MTRDQRDECYTSYLFTYAKVRGDIEPPSHAFVVFSATSMALATHDAKSGDPPRSSSDLLAEIDRLRSGLTTTPPTTPALTPAAESAP